MSSRSKQTGLNRKGFQAPRPTSDPSGSSHALPTVAEALRQIQEHQKSFASITTPQASISSRPSWKTANDEISNPEPVIKPEKYARGPSGSPINHAADSNMAVKGDNSKFTRKNQKGSSASTHLAGPETQATSLKLPDHDVPIPLEGVAAANLAPKSLETGEEDHHFTSDLQPDAGDDAFAAFGVTMGQRLTEEPSVPDPPALLKFDGTGDKTPTSSKTYVSSGSGSRTTRAPDARNAPRASKVLKKRQLVDPDAEYEDCTQSQDIRPPPSTKTKQDHPESELGAAKHGTQHEAKTSEDEMLFLPGGSSSTPSDLEPGFRLPTPTQKHKPLRQTDSKDLPVQSELEAITRQILPPALEHDTTDRTDVIVPPPGQGSMETDEDAFSGVIWADDPEEAQRYNDLFSNAHEHAEAFIFGNPPPLDTPTASPVSPPATANQLKNLPSSPVSRKRPSSPQARSKTVLYSKSRVGRYTYHDPSRVAGEPALSPAPASFQLEQRRKLRAHHSELVTQRVTEQQEEECDPPAEQERERDIDPDLIRDRKVARGAGSCPGFRARVDDEEVSRMFDTDWDPPAQARQHPPVSTRQRPLKRLSSATHFADLPETDEETDLDGNEEDEQEDEQEIQARALLRRQQERRARRKRSGGRNVTDWEAYEGRYARLRLSDRNAAEENINQYQINAVYTRQARPVPEDAPYRHHSSIDPRLPPHILPRFPRVPFSANELRQRIAERCDNERRFNIAAQTADLARMVQQDQAHQALLQNQGGAGSRSRRRGKNKELDIWKDKHGPRFYVRRQTAYSTESQQAEMEQIEAFPTQAGDRRTNLLGGRGAASDGRLKVHTDGVAGDGGKRGTWVIPSRGRRRLSIGGSSRSGPARGRMDDSADTGEPQGNSTLTLGMPSADTEQGMRPCSPAPDSWQLDPNAVKNTRNVRPAAALQATSAAAVGESEELGTATSADICPIAGVVVAAQSGERPVDQSNSGQSTRSKHQPVPVSDVAAASAGCKSQKPRHQGDRLSSSFQGNRLLSVPVNAMSRDQIVEMGGQLLQELTLVQSAPAGTTPSVGQRSNRSSRRSRQPLTDLPVTHSSEPDPRQAAKLAQQKLEEVKKNLADAERAQRDKPITSLPSKIGLSSRSAHQIDSGGQTTLAPAWKSTVSPSAKELQTMNRKKTEAVFAKEYRDPSASQKNKSIGAADDPPIRHSQISQLSGSCSRRLINPTQGLGIEQILGIQEAHADANPRDHLLADIVSAKPIPEISRQAETKMNETTQELVMIEPSLQPPKNILSPLSPQRDLLSDAQMPPVPPPQVSSPPTHAHSDPPEILAKRTENTLDNHSSTSSRPTGALGVFKNTRDKGRKQRARSASSGASSRFRGRHIMQRRAQEEEKGVFNFGRDQQVVQNSHQAQGREQRRGRTPGTMSRSFRRRPATQAPVQAKNGNEHEGEREREWSEEHREALEEIEKISWPTR